METYIRSGNRSASRDGSIARFFWVVRIKNDREERGAASSSSMKLHKLCSGFLQERESGISVLPQGEKLLILAKRVARVAGRAHNSEPGHNGPALTRDRQSDAPMVDEPLMFRRSLRTCADHRYNIRQLLWQTKAPQAPLLTLSIHPRPLTIRQNRSAQIGRAHV